MTGTATNKQIKFRKNKTTFVYTQWRGWQGHYFNTDSNSIYKLLKVFLKNHLSIKCQL